jgi:RHS repeat-associated protein
MQASSSMTAFQVCAFVCLFTGKERDTESGLDYFGARYYASSMGRWMSPDWSAKEEPVPYAEIDNPQSLNLYSYVYNNPLSKADSHGHCPQCAALLPALPELGALGPVGWMVIGVGVVAVGAVAAYEHFHQNAAPAPTPTAPAAPAQPTSDAKPQEPTTSTGGDTAGKRFKPGDRQKTRANNAFIAAGRQPRNPVRRTAEKPIMGSLNPKMETPSRRIATPPAEHVTGKREPRRQKSSRSGKTSIRTRFRRLCCCFLILGAIDLTTATKSQPEGDRHHAGRTITENKVL